MLIQHHELVARAGKRAIETERAQLRMKSRRLSGRHAAMPNLV